MRSLRHLEVFRAVAETRSFTRAAERLHVSQPVVSRTVRELERSLGVTLLVRTTRTVELTPHGEALLEITQDLLGRFDRAMDRFIAYCRGEYGRIVVATLPSIAAAVLPPVLVDLVAEHPDAQIEILDVTADEATRAVRSGSADLAIASPATGDGFDVEPLLRDRFVAVLPTAHPLAARRSLTWRGWPEGSHSEGRFGIKLLEELPDARFAFWGTRDSGEWVEHIGDVRTGIGY